MDSTIITAGIGIVSSLIVHWLKRIAWVENNPKLTVLILSLIGTGLTQLLGSKSWAVGVLPAIGTLLGSIGTAIGTHEVALSKLDNPAAASQTAPLTEPR